MYQAKVSTAFRLPGRDKTALLDPHCQADHRPQGPGRTEAPLEPGGVPGGRVSASEQPETPNLVSLSSWPRDVLGKVCFPGRRGPGASRAWGVQPVSMWEAGAPGREPPRGLAGSGSFCWVLGVGWGCIGIWGHLKTSRRAGQGRVLVTEGHGLRESHRRPWNDPHFP